MYLNFAIIVIISPFIPRKMQPSHQNNDTSRHVIVAVNFFKQARDKNETTHFRALNYFNEKLKVHLIPGRFPYDTKKCADAEGRYAL